jgi:5-methyltetrahydrofolate--homocysteine methyltransferase
MNLQPQTGARVESIEARAEGRVLLLDGAMGTEVGRIGLLENDYRGSRFAAHPRALSGNHDLLALSAPSVLTAVHRAYLEVGCDVIQTATFNANRFSQAAYGLEALAYEMNLRAAALARAVADEFSERDPEKPRFVAGTLGPSPHLLSRITAQGEGAPGERDYRAAYAEQARALIDGGADLLLLETVTCRRTLEACLGGVEEARRASGRAVPISISLALVDREGRTPSGEGLVDFLPSMGAARPFSVGLNCSLGARAMRPFLSALRERVGGLVSVHPSAGLPDLDGRYGETPELFAELVSELARDGLASIVGGCCGTTPAHLRLLGERLRGLAPAR